ncbi:uncharacterized protein LOC120258156 [Dioscorea cayenensis subsp. rotundata]|uniref:Uncharacterized protein LOC120258156 n=1 Tax=Dioscorea cayennensis subsp. rotundata TaxID=55577 RepID=A0AB40B2Y9_DIOCR|nr:uncharacterized protein LOC120258156 [Dioscorea cayenensis subsp. rotundata]
MATKLSLHAEAYAMVLALNMQWKQFEISDLGNLSYFLRVEVSQDEKGVFISQKKYTLDLLRQYNMHNCRAAPTPMCTNTKLQIIDGSGDTEAGRYMNKPSKIHGGAAKRVLKYLAGFSDSDWDGSLDDRRSICNIVFKRQEVIALSTIEAKYIEISAAALKHCTTNEQHADLLTKALTVKKHDMLKKGAERSVNSLSPTYLMAFTSFAVNLLKCRQNSYGMGHWTIGVQNPSTFHNGVNHSSPPLKSWLVLFGYNFTVLMELWHGDLLA